MPTLGRLSTGSRRLILVMVVLAIALTTWHLAATVSV